MVGSFVRDLGYEFLFRPADYSLEEVQAILRETGPSAFLDNTSLAHDISHDRFWIADRSRGTILGSALNKIGSRIFFIDALNAQDVGGVLSELASGGVRGRGAARRRRSLGLMHARQPKGPI